MVYVLTVEVSTEGAAAPTRSEIRFDLPGGGTDAEAAVVARGIRKAFRDAYDARVRIVAFQQVDLTREIDIAAAPPAAPTGQAAAPSAAPAHGNPAARGG